MKRLTATLGAIALAASATLAATTTTAKLEVGDKAPKLGEVATIKGETVSSDLRKGEIYVVEFWATWCPPCRAAIPHLNKLQAQYKDEDVTVIGVTGEYRGQTSAKVKKFVDGKGDDMAYTVVFEDGTAMKNWMQAAGRRGIPSAFVVDHEGRLAYIGHPSEGMDKAVAKAVKARNAAPNEAR